MNRGVAPLTVLALAPLLLLAPFLATFGAVLRAPGVDLRDARAWAAVAAGVCPADALVVMGAAQYDGTPSAALERRLRGAAELYRSGCAPVVVVSGGNRPGDRTSEGEAGVAWLAALGLPAEALRAETRATTSVENLRFAMEVAPPGRWVIVTDDLHALRSGLVAERLGIDAATVGVRTAGDRTRYALRESTAIVAYRLGAFR
jgi:uncharacterized SAM-binding protein YcdF (DUF218 family)